MIAGLGSGVASAQDEDDEDKEDGENNGNGPLGGDPFTLGIASGDPLPDAVVIWTRLAPEPLVEDGGMPDRDVNARWEVATDEDMNDRIEKGTVKASPESTHSVHVDVQGLDSNTEYYYQFKVGPDRSPVGRMKTAPAADESVDEFNFAFASCQNYPRGYYTAHQNLAEEDLGLAIHLGDYIYEGDLQGSLAATNHPAKSRACPTIGSDTLSTNRIRPSKMLMPRSRGS